MEKIIFKLEQKMWKTDFADIKKPSFPNCGERR